MKRLLITAALLALAAGCNDNQNKPSTGDQTATANPPARQVSPTTAPATQPTVASSGQPINKYCAVDKDDPIDPNVTYVYEGKVIGFCCEDCIPKFKKDPAKYMKDLK